MTEQLQPTNLELYSRVINAYEKADKDFRLREKWWWLIPICVFVIIQVAYSHFEISLVIFLFAVFINLLISCYFFMRHSHGLLQDNAFKKKYRGLVTSSFGAPRELSRYRLFRKELEESNVTPKDVKLIIPLLVLEQQTLVSYLAQRPLQVWIASTMTAVLTASATNWPYSFVAQFFSFGLGFLLIPYVIPEITGNHRRRYELHRWLAWYKADAPKVSTPSILTPDGANPLPD